MINRSFLVIFICLLVISLAGITMAAPTHVLIATSGSASSMYFSSQAMWNVINKYSSDIVIGSLVETGGSYDECNRVGIAKECHIGEQTAIGPIQELYSGNPPFEQGNPDLRLLYGTSIGVYPFCVRVDENIRSLEDLHGKKYNEGPPGSGESVLTKAILDSFGIKPEYRSSSVADAVNMMKNRQIVGYTKFTNPDSLDSSMMDIATTQKITWLGFTKEQTEEITRSHPLFFWHEVEEGTVDELPEVKGWFYAAIMTGWATNELSQEVAYHIVKTIFENTEEITTAYPKWGLGIGTAVQDQINLFKDTEGIPPMHSGVIKYWEELGLDIPEKLIPPEYKNN